MCLVLCRRAHLECVLYYVGVRILSDVPNTAICQAAHAGFEDTVAVLLSHGANTSGAVAAAARSGHARVVALLAAAGADIDEEVCRQAWVASLSTRQHLR